MRNLMLKRDYRFSGMKSNQNIPPFIRRKVVPGRGVTRVLELPAAIQFFIHSLTKPGEQFTWDERKSWLGFCDGKDDLLAGPTFLHRNTLVRPAGSTRSKQLSQGETIRACATAVLDNFCRWGVKHGQRQTLITQTSSPKTETLCETNTFPKVSVLESGYWILFLVYSKKHPYLSPWVNCRERQCLEQWVRVPETNHKRFTRRLQNSLSLWTAKENWKRQTIINFFEIFSCQNFVSNLILQMRC